MRLYKLTITNIFAHSEIIMYFCLFIIRKDDVLMKVCIAEKPSVAREIAEVLGATQRMNGYIEGNGYQVTWTFGHLCTLKEPHEYAENWKRWSLGSLPMIPPRFGIKLIENPTYEQQFKVIESLMQNAEMVINCGDAGQEGELIQRWVMQKAGARCPVKRLWISSLTEEAIREGFAKLKDQTDFQSLYEAGLSRAMGDWLLGMNATRLYTIKYGQNKQVLSIGRVQTPTLALIDNRQLEIANFEPKQYWELKTNYRDTTFSALIRKSDEEIAAEEEKNGGKKKIDNPGIDPIANREEGEALVERIKDLPFVVTSVGKKDGREFAPRLFDLTSLQVECNKKFAYSADETLKLIQSLYEKKVATYPRVDTTFLSDDIYPKCPAILKGLRDYEVLTAPLAGTTLPKSKKVFDNSKVTDHHAIIPTMEIEKTDIKALPLGERNLFLLVCCKLLCASAEPYVYETVTATFDCCGHSFTAKGKRVISEGWREIDRIFRAFLKEKPADGDGDMLPDFTEGQTFDSAEVAVTEHFTQPPKPYTEDTLLSAMENAGKDGIPDEAERKGLGTPATRAAIIEKLVAAGFVERKGKSLIPTKAGINLVTILPEPLTSPMLTAEWEQKLTEIAKGSTDPDTFMDGIRTMIQEIVSTYSCISEDGKKLFAPEKEVIGTCPRCGQPVYEGKKNFACSDRSCGFVLWKNDRFWTSRKKELTKKMATDLLKKGRTNVKGMWSEKKQATYDAAVILDDTGGKYINFKLEFPKRKVGADGRK